MSAPARSRSANCHGALRAEGRPMT
jgi:hypothetical protein